MTAKASLTEESVVQVDGMTANVRTFLSMGKLTRSEDGRYLTTGKHPYEPCELHPEAFRREVREPDPYSLDGLRRRGYRVLPGDTLDTDRVEIGGGFFRITEARKHGLI
ncbi:hypothetical protein KDX16_19840 [Burkholderia vietnamiensis]|uniref:hypothetical protein n=1 Tax=Burkholderia vietnamiensis TaxID=60552 RepID=UPI0015883136|nr:hypothetical protein [Burkholderia vietnamiensis]MBR7918040.1 hypothetical protein [Burkholderia vietnamiensis]